MTFETFWESINQHNSKYIRKYFKQYAINLLQALLADSINYEKISIGVTESKINKWALLTHDPWNSDKQLSLRLNKKGVFELYFNCYEEDDYQNATYVLEGDDLDLIPDGLKVIMKKAMLTQKPISIERNTLSAMLSII